MHARFTLFRAFPGDTGRPPMKSMTIAAAALLLAASTYAMKPALAATADDVKWINRCVDDNKNEGAKKEVVLKYCTCMNNKMSDNETQSITQWEKTHKTEQAACSREAGWK
jgi:hypothetical protein